MQPTLSVVIPVYNGADSIENLLKKLSETLKDIDFEVVLVNDGSKDDSEKVCSRLSSDNQRVKFISLRKNFGEFNAVICGLNYANGQNCVIIDDDFQQHPSEILKLVNAANASDLDVVYGRYLDKKHHWFRNFGSWLVNQINTFAIGKPADLYLSSFKLIRQEIVQEIIQYKGPYPYIDGLIFRVTQNVGSVNVHHQARQNGQSSYTFKKLISLFLNILIGYSTLPLRICTFLGVILSVVGVGLFIIFMIQNNFDGWHLPALFVLLIVGFQLTFLGILGEYLGKLFMMQSGLPQFVIKKKILHDTN